MMKSKNSFEPIKIKASKSYLYEVYKQTKERYYKKTLWQKLKRFIKRLF